jgi:hypothetical protein
MKNLFLYLTEGLINQEDRIHHIRNPEVLDGFTILLFIRNPYERILSRFLDKYRTGSDLYMRWDHERHPLTFRNLVHALLEERIMYAGHNHHFATQLSEDWEDRLRLHRDLYILNLHSINSSRLEIQFGKTIPREVLEFRWAYPSNER